jgi:hypothetical protein
MRINPPVSEGKVDTSVNGPADDGLCWDAVDWRFHEDNVRRLRQRIVTAARDGDLSKLRNLQKLMLRSWSTTLLCVRQATQLNAGRTTAGVDGEVRVDSPGQGGAGGAGAPRCSVVATSSGQAGVPTQGG